MATRACFGGIEADGELEAAADHGTDQAGAVSGSAARMNSCWMATPITVQRAVRQVDAVVVIAKAHPHCIITSPVAVALSC